MICRHGAETVEESDQRTAMKKTQFRGAGYRLGETEDASEMVAGATSREEPRKVRGERKIKGCMFVTLTLVRKETFGGERKMKECVYECDSDTS